MYVAIRDGDDEVLGSKADQAGADTVIGQLRAATDKLTDLADSVRALLNQ